MVALVDTTNDNLVNNEKIPVGCGSEGSSAEALCVEDTLFRSQGAVTILDKVNMIHCKLCTTHINNRVSTSTDMFQDVHNIELARDMQHMRIRKKKRQTIRPLPGSLFLTKSSGVQRIPLKAAVNGKPPARFSQKQARTEQFGFCCIWLNTGLLSHKHIFDVFMFLSFSCIALEFISMRVRSPVRLQNLFASL